METRQKRNFYKWVLYVALLLFFAILQSTVLSNVHFLHGSVQLLPFGVTVIAMLEGPAGGAAAGLMMDAMSVPAEGYFTLMYALCGVLASLLNLILYRKTYPVSLLLWAVLLVFSDLFYDLFFFIITGRGGILTLLQVLPGEILTTVLFTPLMYLGVWWINCRYAPGDD